MGVVAEPTPTMPTRDGGVRNNLRWHSACTHVCYGGQSFMPPCGTRNDENGVGLWWPMVGGGCRVGGR